MKTLFPCLYCIYLLIFCQIKYIDAEYIFSLQINLKFSGLDSKKSANGYYWCWVWVFLGVCVVN